MGQQGHREQTSEADCTALTQHEPTEAQLTTKERAEAVTEVLGAVTLDQMLPLGSESGTFGVPAMAELVKGVGPRDPLERMLVEQLSWCHERVRSLSMMAVKSTDRSLRLSAHRECDRSMTAYRCGMVALKEYRGARGPTPVVAVQQVNQGEAGDVVISPHPEQRSKDVKNKQEIDDGR